MKMPMKLLGAPPRVRALWIVGVAAVVLLSASCTGSSENASREILRSESSDETRTSSEEEPSDWNSRKPPDRRASFEIRYESALIALRPPPRDVEPKSSGEDAWKVFVGRSNGIEAGTEESVDVYFGLYTHEPHQNATEDREKGSKRLADRPAWAVIVRNVVFQPLGGGPAKYDPATGEVSESGPGKLRGDVVVVMDDADGAFLGLFRIVPGK